jgi:hypothetical protein
MLTYINGARRAISGASLAQLRRRMSAAECAVLAADVIDGRIVLQGLTVKAIAALVGVNLGYVHAALKLTPEQRHEVRRGHRRLVPPGARAPAAPIDWTTIDDNVLVEAIRRIGLDRTLSAAVEAETTISA